MVISSALLRLLDDASIRLVSIDCFDTLLLRDCSAELSRFHNIACRLSTLPACQNLGLSARALLQSRLHAVEIAYRTSHLTDGGREATLSDILKLQLYWLGIDNKWLENFRQVEIDYEVSSLRLNQTLLSVCQSARERGKTVVVASDMYLDAAAIIELLDRHGAANMIDRVYVSSECGVTKRGGGMFSIISKLESTPLSSILHIGDSFSADYLMPLSLGINAYWLPRHWGWRAVLSLRNVVARHRFRPLKVVP